MEKLQFDYWPINDSEWQSFIADGLHEGPFPFSSVRAEKVSDWGEVNELLSSGLLDYPRIRIANSENEYTRAFSGFTHFSYSARGEKLPRLIPGVIYKAMKDGCTVIVDDCDKFLPGVRRLTDELASRLNCQSWANLYISPKGTSGFGCHFDDHDVLALQLYGTKEWSIYAPSYHAPDRGDKSFHLPSPSGSPTVVSRLEVGNGLYLTFGYWHNVETLSNISLHVTVGLDFARRGDVLDELARELAKDRFFRDKLQIDNCAEAALIKSRLVETIQQLDVGKLLVRMQNQRNQKPRTFRFPNP